MLRNIACCATWLIVYGADWHYREWANLCCANQFCATWLIVYGPLYTLTGKFTCLRLPALSMAYLCSYSRWTLPSSMKWSLITRVNTEGPNTRALIHTPSRSFFMYRRSCSLFRTHLLRILKGANFNFGRTSWGIRITPPPFPDAWSTNSI
jgi:hypothetical protein